MVRRIGDGDISEETQSNTSKFLLMAGGVILVGVIFFLLIWFASRLNYKLFELRSNFWPVIGWTLFVVIIILALFFAFIFLVNLGTKKGSYEDEHME